MLGFIKKDLFMLKNNLKSLLLACIVYFFFILANGMDIGFILPFMIVMLSISSFSYDDFNNWHLYALSIPNGRRFNVLGRYLSTIFLVVVGGFISFLLSLGVNIFKNSLNVLDVFESSLTIVLILMFFIIIIFPILFKLGAEKGRLALFIVSFSLFGIAVALKSSVNINISADLLNFLNNYGLILLSVIVIVLLLLSYKLAVRFYLKREF